MNYVYLMCGSRASDRWHRRRGIYIMTHMWYGLDGLKERKLGFDAKWWSTLLFYNIPPFSTIYTESLAKLHSHMYTIYIYIYIYIYVD